MTNTKSQKQRILDTLLQANGNWISGYYLDRVLGISQFHARIKELKEKGYKIESSDHTDERGFKFHRILKAKKESDLDIELKKLLGTIKITFNDKRIFEISKALKSNNKYEKIGVLKKYENI